MYEVKFECTAVSQHNEEFVSTTEKVEKESPLT